MEKEEKSMSPLEIIIIGIISGIASFLSMKATGYIAGKVKSVLFNRRTTDAKE